MNIIQRLPEDIRQYIKWLDQVVAKGIEGKLETADDYYDVAVIRISNALEKVL